MGFSLPTLPFAQSALEPFISAETLQFHYGKHHQTYVNNLNKLIEGTPFADKTLEEIIQAAEGPLFNNAAQVWNHTFYWQGLKPAAAAPQGLLLTMIQRDFGTLDAMKDALANAATTQFGSGWAWLVLNQGKLAVTKTGNADLPMKHAQTALWTIDVWEHAYYVDYRNDRPKYVQQVLNNLVNWDFVAENLTKSS
ncbi:MAG TPA: superoxide dismutase [Candidatus Hydrogenedentes bacterium]|nr:superoxide dismutase [Candidatus Hydrogenedentota bacterium]